VYGASKLAGELMVEASGAEQLVVRTSGVLGRGGSRAKGGSFVERILTRARGGEALRVVSDQVFAPTFAPDLAAAILALLERGARGLVHVTNSGSTTWHGLAAAALRLAGCDAPLQAIRSAELGAAARRPAYSVLSTERLAHLGVGPLRPWQDALRELLA
jgi:dTDP-4-dehydrorhamnose reductase